MKRLSEIPNFGKTVLTNENVGRFEVNMYDAFFVQEKESFGSLLKGEYFGVQGEAFVLSHEAIQRSVLLEL